MSAALQARLPADDWARSAEINGRIAEGDDVTARTSRGSSSPGAS
jgi:hypothetical protein